MKLLFPSFILICLLSNHALALKCRNEKGLEVDWFLSIRLVSKADERAYAIMDSKSKKFRLTSEDQLYNNALFDAVDAKNDYILGWNDNPGDNYHSEEEDDDSKPESTSYAHSKGILVVSKKTNTGFLLSHSIPDYPDIGMDRIYALSPEGSSYGQHGLCITLKQGRTDADMIWAHLQHTKPNIYIDRFDYTTNQEKVWRYPTEITTFDLNGFTAVVKQKGNKQEIYEEILIPFWKRVLRKPSLGFFTETWGRPLKDSICTGDSKVNDIMEVKVLDHPWRVTQDHSKWALSDDPSTNLFCTSDLNHMSSQTKRGGMLWCIRDKEVYQEISKIIVSTRCNTLPKQSLMSVLQTMMN